MKILIFAFVFVFSACGADRDVQCHNLLRNLPYTLDYGDVHDEAKYFAEFFTYNRFYWPFGNHLPRNDFARRLHDLHRKELVSLLLLKRERFAESFVFWIPIEDRPDFLVALFDVMVQTKDYNQIPERAALGMISDELNKAIARDRKNRQK